MRTGGWLCVPTVSSLFFRFDGCSYLKMLRGEIIKSAVSETTKDSIPKTFKRLATIPSVQLVLALSIGIFFINHGLNNWLPEIIRVHGLSAASAGYWASIPTAVSVLDALLIPRYATPEVILILALLIISSCVATLLLQIAPGPIMLTRLRCFKDSRSAMMTVALLLLVEIPNVGPKRAGTAGGLFYGGLEGIRTSSNRLVHDSTGGFSYALITIVLLRSLCLHCYIH